MSPSPSSGVKAERTVRTMLFNSVHFLLFFPAVLLTFHLLPRTAKPLWLLLCSYYFYMSWNAKYALLLLFSTVVTYGCALAIEKVSGTHAPNDPSGIRLKRLILGAGIGSNLAILFFFKYLNLFFDVIVSLGECIGITVSAPAWDLLLPVGISFYTFQAIGYTVDVYRNHVAAEKNFIRYALFVSFFPQLVAGPIERSSNLIAELQNMRRPDWTAFRRGFVTMIWGFFLKMVIADRIAIFVDAVYASDTDLSGAYILAATVLFAFQIYCDFAGYSIIAQGAAQTLGIRLMDNFHTPYLSTSVRKFWRRWHVSLSSWFRDYLYIPLGGSRRGTARTYLNLLIVFAVSGLWHGAEWSFVVWGLLNGMFQIAEDLLDRTAKKLCRTKSPTRTASLGEQITRTLLTFALVDITWIFFRADTINTAIRLIRNLLFHFDAWVLFDQSIYSFGLSQQEFSVMLSGIGILLFSDIMAYRGCRLSDLLEAQPLVFRWTVYILSILAIVVFGVWGTNYDAAGFIYFQF